MNIYINFNSFIAKDELTQAIKVFALSNKDIQIKVLVNSDSNHTFNNEDNLSLVNNIEDDNYFLVTSDDNEFKSDISFTMLKTVNKKKIIFGDLSLESDLSISEKLSLIQKTVSLPQNFTYCLMSIPNIRYDEMDEFDKTHKNDKNYLGIIPPDKIYEVLPDICLTSPLTAHVFIGALNATINFVNVKNKNKEENKSIFSKMLSNLGNFNNAASKEERINYLIDECTVKIKESNVCLCTKNDGTYAFYFAMLNLLRTNLIEENLK